MKDDCYGNVFLTNVIEGELLGKERMRKIGKN